MTKRVCVVAGVGAGNGASFARRFALEGYAVALLARTPGFCEELAATLEDARAYSCDLADPEQIVDTFKTVRDELGEVDTLIYNAGSGVLATIEDLNLERFENAWRVNALGAAVAAQQVFPAMKIAGHGNIVLIGATASRRGGAQFASFASAKAAQRSLAESMARHLWPMGIHVSLVIVDGVVDRMTTRARMPSKPDSFFMNPDDIAEIVLSVTKQNRSAWSFEVEARPFAESW